MSHIFLSYSRIDIELAKSVCARLEAQGHNVWWDRELLAGDNFNSVIKEKLDSAKFVVVIWSMSSVRSSWVYSEAQMADAQGKLVTVREPELALSMIPLPFNGRHTPNLEEISLPEHVELRHTPHRPNECPPHYV